MEWLINHIWIVVPLFLVGVIINAIKDLNRLDYKKFLRHKPKLPPHRDCNDKWDDDDDQRHDTPRK
ncbi:YpfN family protein [Enterobacteriaceae bacterium ESL0689]|nr:YpfN family protein [Enterobacteriaceae bacterium ESL0689]